MFTSSLLPSSLGSASYSGAPAQPPAAVLSLVAVLRELGSVISTVTEQQYRMNPVGEVSSSIGGHVRHCLDHIEALLNGIARGELDYDARQRGTEVETSRAAALEVIRRQEQRLLDLPASCEPRSLCLSAVVNSSHPARMVVTSIGRELVFVLSHTIHHNALVAVMARTLGIPIPERFGYAPSTVAHLEKRGCVR